MIARSPVGKLETAGGVLSYMHNCNWKMLVENQTDTCHPMVAHMSSAGTAIDLWKRAGEPTPRPMAVELIAPFMSPYEMFETMGIRTWENGHGHTGVSHSIHSNYSAVPGYFEQMVAAYGEDRAKAILDEIDKKVDPGKMEEKLMEEGTLKFADPQKALLKLIGEKRAAVG